MSARKVSKKKSGRSGERAANSSEVDEETAAADAESSVSFEGAIHRLGEIVEELEAGELPLEESLALFEEGVGLARRSQGILQRAERRVEQLLSVDEQGEPIVKELDLDGEA